QNGSVISGQGTNNVTIVWSATGPYSIILNESIGQCSQTSNLLVSQSGCPVSVNVTKIAPSPVCVGDTILLVAQVTAASSIQWIKDGSALPGQNGDTLKVTALGSYQLSASDGNCNSMSNAEVIVFNILPVAPQITTDGAIVSCQTQPVILYLNHSYS